MKSLHSLAHPQQDRLYAAIWRHPQYQWSILPDGRVSYLINNNAYPEDFRYQFITEGEERRWNEAGRPMGTDS